MYNNDSVQVLPRKVGFCISISPKKDILGFFLHGTELFALGVIGRALARELITSH